jgi:hypothetical protein
MTYIVIPGIKRFISRLEWVDAQLPYLGFHLSQDSQ